MTIEQHIKLALEEDLGAGDHTTNACIDGRNKFQARLLVKEKGILAGMKVARKVFKVVDPELEFEALLRDGKAIEKGDEAFYVKGKASSILKGERLALNYLQRMSGIATHTRKLADLIKDLPCKLLDTRKTTPAFRQFEKMAVKTGGGVNHRFGLYDMIMIKDNHIDFAGGIEKAVQKTRKYLEQNKLDLKIEVEARNLEEVNEILAAGPVDRIMLDNFNYADLSRAVEIIGDRAETEASGGINEHTIREYALCGVDYISVGALTHQVNSLDLSLKAVN
jgi:nicotinate-nucleotide pyrophosphorylase (carboxylating)